MRVRKFLAAVAVAALVAMAWGPAMAAEKQLLVFGAASTTNALNELGQAFAKEHGVKVVNSFASSSTLAKQIAQGAPADLFVSANVKWMDYLVKRGEIQKGTRVNLLANRLVLIAPADSKLAKITPAKGMKLAALLGDSRLAMGDPSHVPAGIYAKKALSSLGLWPQVKDKLAAAANVRAALALVEAGEAPLGVVYATDAAVSRKVRVLGMFPAASHPPIVYPAALVKGRASALAKSYLKFLQGDKASAVFRKYGFLQH